MAIHPLLGAWQLEQCEISSENGDKLLPYGENPQGFLFYSEGGLMSVSLMCSDRERFASEDLAAASTDEKIAAFDSFDAYSGKYEIDASKSLVTHYIKCARVPNWVGGIQRRAYRAIGDNLILSSEPFVMHSQTWRAVVRWKRLRTIAQVDSKVPPSSSRLGPLIEG